MGVVVTAAAVTGISRRFIAHHRRLQANSVPISLARSTPIVSIRRVANPAHA